MLRQGFEPNADEMSVITKVFPDEYHLHTLDQMLSAIARLNPHVDMKKIVIGLMDRLSSFAQRETETDTMENRRRAEEEATTRMLGQMQISGDSKGDQQQKTASSPTETNGATPDETAKDGGDLSETTTMVDDSATPTMTRPTVMADVRLYEIFYDQVVNLVKTRGLSIQDTMALLTSLVNLAL